MNKKVMSEKIHCWMRIHCYLDLESLKIFHEKIKNLSELIMEKIEIKKNEVLILVWDICVEDDHPVLYADFGWCEMGEQENIFMLKHSLSGYLPINLPKNIKGVYEVMAEEMEKSSMAKHFLFIPHPKYSVVICLDGSVVKYIPDDITDNKMAEKISKNLKKFKTPKLNVNY